MQGKILVATWGYSMVLTTWVKVLKVSSKTLLVQELENESAKAPGEPEPFRPWVMPSDVMREKNGSPQAPFRLYKRGLDWRGTPTGSTLPLTFKEWDGKPIQEDHLD